MKADTARRLSSRARSAGPVLSSAMPDALAELHSLATEAAALAAEGRRFEYTTYLRAWHSLHRLAQQMPAMTARELVGLQHACLANDTAHFARLLGELEERLGSGSRSRL